MSCLWPSNLMCLLAALLQLLWPCTSQYLVLTPCLNSSGSMLPWHDVATLLSTTSIQASFLKGAKFRVPEVNRKDLRASPTIDPFFAMQPWFSSPAFIPPPLCVTTLDRWSPTAITTPPHVHLPASSSCLVMRASAPAFLKPFLFHLVQISCASSLAKRWSIPTNTSNSFLFHHASACRTLCYPDHIFLLTVRLFVKGFVLQWRRFLFRLLPFMIANDSLLVLRCAAFLMLHTPRFSSKVPGSLVPGCVDSGTVLPTGTYQSLHASGT